MQSKGLLTLTLSPAEVERGQQCAPGEVLDDARYADRLTIILPLPIGWGEGQGEGLLLLKASGL